MSPKRLNIMLYGTQTGEQIILPINPKSIDIKYEKSFQKYKILGFGEVNIPEYQIPLRITLAHFLPEDDSVFGTNSGILYEKAGSGKFYADNYSSAKAVEILRKWATNNNTVRLVIDNDLNVECQVISFVEVIRESTISKPYRLELAEYKNPVLNTKSKFGLIKRAISLARPSVVVMKSKDTLFSIASKFELDLKELKKKNNIEDADKPLPGREITIED